MAYTKVTKKTHFEMDYYSLCVQSALVCVQSCDRAGLKYINNMT